MTRRTRIFIGILLIYTAGIAFLLYRVVSDIDPRYRESAEESLVETSQLMASLVEQDVIAGAINTARLEPLFRSVYTREFSAQIYNLHKSRVELRVYVTDRTGRVMFDSLGRHLGNDYSQWSDVKRTLGGLYGARTSRDVDGDPRTSVMYVGAPIRWNDEIVGVVSVGKPVQSFGQFVEDGTRAHHLGRRRFGAGAAAAHRDRFGLAGAALRPDPRLLDLAARAAQPEPVAHGAARGRRGAHRLRRNARCAHRGATAWPTTCRPSRTK